jgi:hypothetical protein
MHQKEKKESHDYYFPLYNLKNPLADIKVGFSIMQPFEKLPRQIRKLFLSHWENQYKINNEYITSKKNFLAFRKASAFLHIQVMANNWTDAIDQSHKLAETSVSILNFIYRWHFPILEGQFLSGDKIKGGNRVSHGYTGDYYYKHEPALNFIPEFEKEISIFTDILTNPKTRVDNKINNALSIFSLQTSISNEGTRYVLLATCLESLLLDKNDRDYLRWRLAEKCAFLFMQKRKEIYDKIKKTYDKRSSFVHGSGEPVSAADLNDIQDIVVSILRRIVELRNQGFDTMEKIDEYITQEKFRER